MLNGKAGRQNRKEDGDMEFRVLMNEDGKAVEAGSVSAPN